MATHSKKKNRRNTKRKKKQRGRKKRETIGCGFEDALPMHAWLELMDAKR
ncbi:MAG: hypothetical protein AAF654_11395 [Myxococcota bacterium]